MAPTKHTIAALMGMIQYANGQALSSYSTADTCLRASQQWTLGNTVTTSSDDPNFTSGGTCCTSSANGGAFSSGATDNCVVDCTTTFDAFCATGATITNRMIRPFLETSKSDKCPNQSDSNVVLSTTGSGAEVVTVHNFEGTIPDSSAADWHCKYKISAASSLVPQPLDATKALRDNNNGYIYIEAQQVGFDKNVQIFMQPPEKVYDFNYRSTTNNPMKQTYVGVSQYGRKYVFPAEYDIFIDFEPLAYNTGSEEEPTTSGKFQFKAYHTTSMPSGYSADDTTWTFVDRIETLVDQTETVTADDGTTSEQAVVEVTPDQLDPNASQDSVAPTDDNDLPATKTDFVTGETASQGTRWQEEEAFTVGETVVTKEQAATASGVVIALIVVIVLLCCFFSYIERKKIEEQGRRMSTAIRRASTKLRRGSKADEQPEKPSTDKDIELAAKSAGGDKKQAKFLQDTMKAQRDADDINASQTSMQHQAQQNQNQKGDDVDGLPRQNSGYQDPTN